jgi:hypothetical protein
MSSIRRLPVMTAYKERRIFERYSDQFDLVYSPIGSSNFNNATTCNCSMGGMYITSRYPLAMGSKICIKLLSYCSIFEANVLRSEKIENSTGPFYGHGIEFSEPIIQS